MMMSSATPSGEDVHNFRVIVGEFGRALSALTRDATLVLRQLVLLIAALSRLLCPWLLLAGGRFLRLFRRLSPLRQLGCCLATGLVLLVTRLWRRGTLHRRARLMKRALRRGKNAVQIRVERVRRAVQRFYSRLVRVGTVGLPGIAVTGPLRLYVSRSTFRQVVSVLVGLAALLHSVSALLRYYQQEKNAPEADFNDGAAIESAEETNGRVASWLNYFILAEMVDGLAWVTLAICMSIWGKAALGVERLQRGALLGFPVSGSWRELIGLPSTLRHSSVAERVGGCVEFVYAVVFTMLVMHAMHDNRRDLSAVTRRVVRLIDGAAVSLVGKPVFEDPPEVAAARRASLGAARPGGLLSQAWAVARLYLPAVAVQWINCLCYVPQLLLLLMPTVLLRPAYVFVASWLPLYNSYQALDRGQTARQAYYLVYFTLLTALELTVMQWVREKGIWQLLPLQRHLDILYITALQLFCNSPHAVAQFLARNLVALQQERRQEQERDAAATQQPQQQQQQQPQVRVKEERCSDDDESDRRRLTSKTATRPPFRTSLFTQTQK